LDSTQQQPSWRRKKDLAGYTRRKENDRSSSMKINLWSARCILLAVAVVATVASNPTGSSAAEASDNGHLLLAILDGADVSTVCKAKADLTEMLADPTSEDAVQLAAILDVINASLKRRGNGGKCLEVDEVAVARAAEQESDPLTDSDSMVCYERSKLAKLLVLMVGYVSSSEELRSHVPKMLAANVDLQAACTDLQSSYKNSRRWDWLVTAILLYCLVKTGYELLQAFLSAVRP
jgi:hypothetical protein